MIRNGLSLPRLAGGLLLSVALFACEATVPVAIEHQSPQSAATPEQCIPVTIEAVYSGPPSTDPGVININHQFVFVEILDIEAHLPRPIATADDVRIGDDWETGTPAESFAILDINNDGNRDIRLTFSKSRLVADGHLDLGTTEIEVWGLDRATEPEDLYCGSFAVTVIQPPPAPGADVVVLNDLNPFDNTAMNFAATDNDQFVRNLVTFTSDGPRNDGDVVIWDRGRESRCGPPVGSPAGNQECMNPNMAVARSTIEDEGFTLDDVFSSEGTLIDIPADVKSIWLWLPRIAYTNAEINALKAFAAEGGRVVFIGEFEGFYGTQGIAVQNDFLTKMGAVMRNQGGAVNCGYTTLPPASIVGDHQVMDGVNSLRIACASIVEPGPQDFVLFLDTSMTHVLAGVATIDTTPLTGREMFTQPLRPSGPSEAGLNRGSSTGH